VREKRAKTDNHIALIHFNYMVQVLSGAGMVLPNELHLHLFPIMAKSFYRNVPIRHAYCFMVNRTPINNV